MSAPAQAPRLLDDGAGQLAALSVKSEFKREMGLWGNFALGFTYLSPVAGVYTLFAYALAKGVRIRPEAALPVISAFEAIPEGLPVDPLIVVTHVFKNIALAKIGDIYPWARRLWGRKHAWMTGWVYLWALLATIAVVA